MHFARFLPIAALLAATPAYAAGPAKPAPAYVGTWAANTTQCKVPQDRQAAPLLLTTKGYDQHEAHCRFVSVKTVRKGWRMASTCTVEGNVQRDQLTAKVSGDTLFLTTGKNTRMLKRC